VNRPLYVVELTDLLWLFPAVVGVGFIYAFWTKEHRTVAYGTLRMVLQLLLIGYVLVYLFQAESAQMTSAVLAVMLTAASVIALRPLNEPPLKLYAYAFVSVTAGGALSLVTVLFGVLHVRPWYEPHVAVPLAGMIFANAMNAVSIAAERFESERNENTSYEQARAKAYKASLIPIINAFFAVGLVSLPGMMTGQILSGVDPLVAVRYQMMIMLSVFVSAGTASAIFLTLQRPKKRA
jgi:putative ABC transport system permease protein